MSDHLKRIAAQEAVREIRDGMIVGLGTGSTAAHFIRLLGERVRAGLNIRAIPTSENSAALAHEEGIALTTFEQHPTLDLTVDGADEVSPELDLIKGLGGALVREKVVAHASRRVLIVVDEGKLVDRLGTRTVIPVEAIPFAADLVVLQLQKWGGSASIRQKNGRHFISDNGNCVIDWSHGLVDNALEMEKRIKAVTGVVDSGIFAGIASSVISAGPSGIRRMDR
jgi:ribose 5-phosphate isomerase A